jgi:hypothetical protein
MYLVIAQVKNIEEQRFYSRPRKICTLAVIRDYNRGLFYLNRSTLSAVERKK